MDNKQKRKICKLFYNTLCLLVMACIVFAEYLSIYAIYQKTSSYEWFDISLIIINVLLAITLLYDGFRTRKLKNKYVLANLIYILITLTVIGYIVVLALNYFDKILLTQTNFLSLSIVLVSMVLLIIRFILGINVSKLNMNTTITIDADSETPNFDDELLLKKKLDELNRKMEIKKVQEQIDNIEKELNKN